MDSRTGQGSADGVAPVAGWAAGPLGLVQAADREISRQTALRVRAVAEFAATRPASADRPAGTPGAMSADRRAARPEVLADVSEWAAQELVVALSISQVAGENLLERSLTLVHRLPGALAALESGLIHDGHLWSLLDRVAPITDAKIRARVEREVLDWVASRSVTTPAQLGGKVRRTVLRHDASAAAQRLLQAVRARGISARPDRRDGMTVVTALLTTPEAAALMEVLSRYADALDDPDDRRTRGQKMADSLLDLVLRPGEHGHAPVRAQLTLVAGVPTMLGGDQPGEVGSEPVPAEMVRALARALGLLPDTTGHRPAQDEVADDASAAGDRLTTEDGYAAADEFTAEVRSTAEAWSAPEADFTVEDRSTAEDGSAPEEAFPAKDRSTAEDGSAPEEAFPAKKGSTAEEWFLPEDSPEAAALEAWWARVEKRAERGEWRGAEAPPLEVLERWWAEEARWCEPLSPESWALPESSPEPELSRPSESAPRSESPPQLQPSDAIAHAATSGRPGAGWWVDADRAVDDASAALLDLQRAVGNADRAVNAAARAEAADEAAWRESGAGRISRSRGALDALREATTEQRAQLAALLDRGAGGGLLDRPRIAVVDELTGALLALTDSDELRRHATCGARHCRRNPSRCDHDLSDRPGVGPPGPSDGYRPRAALDRFVRARDRRCRFPGCHRRVPLGGELDHDRPWPEGPTSAGNLVGYCTGHHRGKHQAPGWQHDLAPDGTLTVTTPSGMVASTTPPPY